MADSVVSFLLQNLSRLLEDEHKLFFGVKDKINLLRNELKFIDIFLKSSEGKRNNDVVKEVVSQIRDVAHRAEDVVDIYVANVTKHRHRTVLSKLFHLKERFMVLHDLHTEINKIKSSIEEIYKNKERYNIGEGEFRSEELVAVESLRKKRRDVEEEDVVGLVHDSGKVIQQLRERDLRRKVVSIIGMGGLGKTTLARKIYNNNQVKKLFPCRAWGYVSNDYRASELLLSLLQCLMSTFGYNDLIKRKKDEGEVLGEEELKKKVGECLKGNKYLIVLDDIWKTQVWDEVKGAFPDDKNGSRILITSRINEVAHYTGTTSPYYLPFLNNDESWELFSKKVFQGEDCPSDLMALGRSIAESCGGLPLAIVVLAGLVAKKEKSQREWKRIKEVNWHLTQDKTEVMDILKLSYDNLPQKLKPCFLYFGIYPEDYEIHAKDLIQLWISEGFIQQEETGTPNPPEVEDIGEYYLDELVDRSLVQVESRRNDWGVKTCRIHDLLRDLCILESKSDKFLEVCTNSNFDMLNNVNPRRLSLHYRPQSYISSSLFNQLCTRSLFLFSREMYPDDILKSFKLARVLYSKSEESRIPPQLDLKSMIHLRYLKIDTPVNNIPASVSCLWNLETLDVCYIATVSSEVWKLKQLRHLYLRGGRVSPVLPEAYMKGTGNLQILYLKARDPKMVSLINNDLFLRLRKLVLYHYYPSPFHSGRGRLERLPRLHCLSNLESLKVIDYLELPSDANAFPSNLTKMTWKQLHVSSEIFITSMKTLGQLTNLQILKLTRQHFDHIFNLDLEDGMFPQLQVFQMRGIKLERWRLGKGAMPCLQCLLIESCPYLFELPQQLWCLTTLRQVHVLAPSEELVNNLQNVELKNGCKLIISRPPTRNS